MLRAFNVVFQLIWLIIKIPLFIIAFLFVCFFVAVLIYLADYLFRGNKLPKRSGVSKKVVKRHSFLRCWFLDAPKQYLHDVINRPAGLFEYQGCIIFTGRQGFGKTISAIEFIRHMQFEYQNLKVITNAGYANEDMPLYDWKPLITYTNGIYGVCVFIDEMQNWFSSNDSKNFPPEMLEVITQNRKNRRIILGTAQCFNRLSKPIREQATEVRQCYTILRCFTFVIRREPYLDSEGNVVKMKYRGMYFFVHDEDLRNSYDTYKVISSLARSGFQPKAAESVVKINQTIVQSKGRK